MPSPRQNGILTPSVTQASMRYFNAVTQAEWYVNAVTQASALGWVLWDGPDPLLPCAHTAGGVNGV